jgi:6,7-dimethyl-8-ribityllumazine synthase
MAGKSASASGAYRGQGLEGVRVLIIEARYYAHIADALMAGAVAELNAAGIAHDKVSVPGALEIPLALAQAVHAGAIGGTAPRFAGCVAL